MTHINDQAETASRRLGLAETALLAAIAALCGVAAQAQAGTYSVIQCSNDFGVGASGASWYSTGNYRQRTECDDDGRTGVEPTGASSPGQFGAMIWDAPYGAEFTHLAWDVGYGIGDGNTPQVYFENHDGSGRHYIVNGEQPSFSGTVVGGPPTGRGRVVARLLCQAPAIYTCRNSSISISTLRFEITDYAAPAVFNLGGSLVAGGWISGNGLSLSADAFDYGSGVTDTYVFANGSQIAHQNFSCDYAAGVYFKSVSPCEGGSTRSSGWSGIDVRQGNGAFAEGTNPLTICANDLATTSGSPNQGCASASVRVDNIAPTPPGPLSLAGGEDWRASNDFDLSWTNPAQGGDVAPLASTHYRITGPGGYNSGDQEVGLTTQLNNLSVPANGEYTLQVWAEDAAGNASAASARSAQLRYDSTVPPPAEARFNGWIRRADFPYDLRWEKPNPVGIGPSGLDGYAMTITSDPNSDPCVTPAHPAQACAPSEVTNAGGIDDISEVVEIYPEGTHYVHVAPVSGAGVKTGNVKHTLLPVDRSDPVSQISGVPDAAWVNRDVVLTVNARDPLSGMNGDPGFPDPQPRTVVTVDGAPTANGSASVGTTITYEGVHQVTHFARDLAGNENNGELENGQRNGAPGTATVRIDKTAPLVAFQNAESEDDPSLITAAAQDALSGVSAGEISLRRIGPTSSAAGDAGEWIALPTQVRDDRIQARVPDDLPVGRYEMRASATDRATNSTTTGMRANGEPMVVDVPLKTGTEIIGGFGKRKRAVAKTRYRRSSMVSGTLRTRGGSPLGGRELIVVERFKPGAVRKQRRRTITTGPGGAFHAPLAPGPSRTVTVTYAGDRRYGDSSLGGNMRVRGRVLRFNAPASVNEDEKIVFTGMVGKLGAKLGKLGKIVQIEFLKGPGQWKTIDAGRTNRRGRFTVPYALRVDYTEPVQFVFRVTVPKERRWPYVGAAHSRPQRVTVRPN